MRKTHVRTAVLAVITAALLAACGSNAASTATTVQEATTAAPATTVTPATVAPTTTARPTTTTTTPVVSVEMPETLLDIVPCDASAQGRTGTAGSAGHEAHIFCEDGKWRVVIGGELPRDTRLAMLDCSKSLLTALMNASLRGTGPSQSLCADAKDMLSLESDPSLLFVQDVVKQCASQANVAAANIVLNGKLGAAEAQTVTGDLGACETLIGAVAKS